MSDKKELLDIWNEEKKHVAQKEQKIYFKERDVFFISMWKNIWREQNGKWSKFARPVIIIKKFTNNLFRWVALTTKKKTWIYYYEFDLKSNKWKRIAILSQIKLYDSKRMLSKIWFIDDKDFLYIRKKLTELLQ